MIRMSGASPPAPSDAAAFKLLKAQLAVTSEYGSWNSSSTCPCGGDPLSDQLSCTNSKISSLSFCNGGYRKYCGSKDIEDGKLPEALSSMTALTDL